LTSLTTMSLSGLTLQCGVMAAYIVHSDLREMAKRANEEITSNKLHNTY